MRWIYILIVSCKLNYIDTVMSPNNQNYCGVSYFLNCYEISKHEVTGAK